MSKMSWPRAADTLGRAGHALEGQSQASGAADTGGLDPLAGFSHSPMNPDYCMRDSGTRCEGKKRWPCGRGQELGPTLPSTSAAESRPQSGAPSKAILLVLREGKDPVWSPQLQKGGGRGSWKATLQEPRLEYRLIRTTEMGLPTPIPPTNLRFQ